MDTLLGAVIRLVFTLYSLTIIARTLLPWLGIGYGHPAMRFCVRVTDPLLVPLRRIVPSTGGIDFTPMVALIVLAVVETALRGLIVLLL
jgi:YggT family protein